MRLRNQRGQIIIFTMLAIVFLVVIAGTLAADVARMISEKNEIQSALDAAALAGAGKLGFDNSVFPTARDFAVNFAGKNPTHAGKVVLNRNDANSVGAFDSAAKPYGDVLLGVWDPSLPDGIGDGKRFKPSLDGTIVNSVMCRYKRQVAANFMSIWGLFQMNIAASAVATANPPQNPPIDVCVFPVGVSACAFQGPTAKGCGTVITMSTSSGKIPLTQAGSNTAAWVSLTNDDASDAAIVSQIDNAFSGACTDVTAKSLDANNGLFGNAYKDIANKFVPVFNSSPMYPLSKTNDDGTTTPIYNGHGWRIAIPVLDTPCKDGVPTTLNGTYDIVGWTYMVVTQVVNKGACQVSNAADGNTASLCAALAADPTKVPDGTTDKKGKPNTVNLNSLNAMFGYYECKPIHTEPFPKPTPRTALATKLRLVR